jgi:V8-like Glu-specific endopeptidase
LAEQLRAQSFRQGVHYIQVEADHALAERTLHGPQGGGSVGGRPRENREINSGGDHRSAVDPTASPQYPYSAFGFEEIGCTATMISPSVAITAAHCIFNILQPRTTSAAATIAEGLRWPSAVPWCLIRRVGEVGRRADEYVR